mmetsp:Transcript_11373/g.19938  ORF Transcript_11373/g.19938 Transcript_11373/m.19938 type:complete len:209 (+) Transcript_11373:1409-2035(+)
MGCDCGPLLLQLGVLHPLGLAAIVLRARSGAQCAELVLPHTHPLPSHDSHDASGGAYSRWYGGPWCPTDPGPKDLPRCILCGPGRLHGGLRTAHARGLCQPSHPCNGGHGHGRCRRACGRACHAVVARVCALGVVACRVVLQPPRLVAQVCRHTVGHHKYSRGHARRARRHRRRLSLGCYQQLGACALLSHSHLPDLWRHHLHYLRIQ